MISANNSGLEKNSVCSFFEHTENYKKNNVQFYNLNKKISIRYLVVNRKQDNILKKATKVLKDYMIKGYLINNYFN